MIINLQDFLDRLEKAPYLRYSVYHREENLFITLYSGEDSDKYLIIEPIAVEEHPPIIRALEQHRK